MLTIGERDLAGASGRDPHQIATLLATAGAAALLMTSAYPELAELSRRLRQESASGDGGTIAVGAVIYSDSPDEAPSGPDPTFPQPSPDPAIPTRSTSKRPRSSTSTCRRSTASTRRLMPSIQASTRAGQ